MPNRDRLPTILDNQDGATVESALRAILPGAESLDVATGTFEISSLLALDGLW